MDSFVKTHLSLKYYTTIHIGGSVEWGFFPMTKSSIPGIFRIIQQKLKVGFFVLGRGSNVIIQEGDWRTAAILTHYLKKYTIEDETLLIAEAGVPMSYLGKVALLQHQLTGLEFVYGLPGSIGGGVFMNARVFGAEFKDIVEWVEVYNYKTKEFLIIEAKDCDYSYKQSIFQHEPYFIYRAALRLKKADPINLTELWNIAQEHRTMRVEKNHFDYPSAGSFFKNDYTLGKSSGIILDELHLKGFQYGDAKVSEHHANFFVNSGNATYNDMYTLMEIVQQKLKEEKGLVLEPEVSFINLENLKP